MNPPTRQTQLILLAGGPGDGLILSVHRDDNQVVQHFHSDCHTDNSPIASGVQLRTRPMIRGVYRRTRELGPGGFPVFRHASN